MRESALILARFRCRRTNAAYPHMYEHLKQRVTIPGATIVVVFATAGSMGRALAGARGLARPTLVRLASMTADVFDASGSHG
jgi:hypothetical protein